MTPGKALREPVPMKSSKPARPIPELGYLPLDNRNCPEKMGWGKKTSAVPRRSRMDVETTRESFLVTGVQREEVNKVLRIFTRFQAGPFVPSGGRGAAQGVGAACPSRFTQDQSSIWSI